MVTGEVRFGVNRVRRASSTCRAGSERGRTVASTVVKCAPRNGSPRVIITAAATTATRAGRRMTKRESRYQAPLVAGRASASAAR